MRVRVGLIVVVLLVAAAQGSPADPPISATAVKAGCAGYGIPSKPPRPPHDDVSVELSPATFESYFNGSGFGLVFSFQPVFGARKGAPLSFSIASSTANKIKTNFSLPVGRYELVIHSRNQDGSAGSNASEAYSFRVTPCP